jgi:hypothetical protein
VAKKRKRLTRIEMDEKRFERLERKWRRTRKLVDLEKARAICLSRGWVTPRWIKAAWKKKPRQFTSKEQGQLERLRRKSLSPAYSIVAVYKASTLCMSLGLDEPEQWPQWLFAAWDDQIRRQANGDFAEIRMIRIMERCEHAWRKRKHEGALRAAVVLTAELPFADLEPWLREAIIDHGRKAILASRRGERGRPGDFVRDNFLFEVVEGQRAAGASLKYATITGTEQHGPLKNIAHNLTPAGLEAAYKRHRKRIS